MSLAYSLANTPSDTFTVACIRKHLIEQYLGSLDQRLCSIPSSNVEWQVLRAMCSYTGSWQNVDSTMTLHVLAKPDCHTAKTVPH